MAIPVEMPKMSDTMDEGVLVSWTAEEGQELTAGDIIAQVETDKATMDLEVYDDGVLLKKVVGEGASIPIGGLIAVLGEKGEDISAILSEYEGAGDGQSAPVDEGEGDAETAEESAEGGEEKAGDAERAAAQAETDEGDGRVKASPLARKMAADRGIRLQAIAGSGPEGRIVKRDVESYTEDGEKATPRTRPERVPAAGEDLYKSARITQMRKTIARRLSESKFTAPHFYLTVDVDMEAAVTLRKQLNQLAEDQGRAKISYNDIITKSCAAALRQHPEVNASYLEKEGEIRMYQRVNIAVAVAVEEGLLTPVVRDVDLKGLAEIAEETKELAGRARDKKLDPADWEGSTFTTSNLGMFGIEEFTAIINPPNACILAIGAIRSVPVVKNDDIIPGKRMKLTLSCDHRVVDGAVGSEFLQTVVKYLQEPMTLLL